MRENFKVIDGGAEDQELAEFNAFVKASGLCNMWREFYYKSLLKSLSKMQEEELPQDDLRKVCFAGTKYLILKDRLSRNYESKYPKMFNATEEALNLDFQEVDVLVSMFGFITPRNLLNTFPVDKEYDGHRWESKDYFYTMDVINKLDMDAPIGRGMVEDLLWDYHNTMIGRLFCCMMNAASALSRLQTGKSIMQEFCEQHNVPTYTMYENDNLMVNNQTGESFKVKKPSPLHVVTGRQ